MNGAAVLRGVTAVAVSAADAAVLRATDALAARAEALLPGAVVVAEPGVVWVQARGLTARAYGSRRRGADARLRALIAGDER